MKSRLLFISFLMATMLSAQQKPSQGWLDQKFSMFIHFGLYSEYGGVYNGEPVQQGYSEQIQSFAGIFSDWYGNTASKFNPVKWNSDEIVKLAKDAGMKSIVFTSKHHDGFCMYHSKFTDFNIVDATPYAKDMMKELAEACERGGIGFGVYYSLIDWHYPQAYPISSHNADPITPEHYAFNMKQVEEIMTEYGPISEIWFDMGSLTLEQSKGLYDLVNRLQPNCMISGRLGNDYVDFAVMADNEYPEYKLGLPWQTAASMFNETWGYRSWQERGSVQDKVDEKIASLVKVVSRGGNYLLNIGPRGDGSVVEFERDVLLEMGRWLKSNSESIYASKSNPFDHPFSFGDITTDGNSLYAFINKSVNAIDIGSFIGKVKDVTLLATNKSLNYTQTKNSLSVQLPQGDLVGPMAVVKIAFDNDYATIPSSIVSGKVLTPQNANPLFGHSSLNYYAGYKSLIGYDWTLKSDRKQTSPKIRYTDSEIGRIIELSTKNETQKVSLDVSNPKTIKLDNNSVAWGNLYRKPGRGVFGNMPEEGNGDVVIDEAWKQVSNFTYGTSTTEKILPRASIVFLQEIQSNKEQTIAVEVESGNAAYILLNGEYVTAHFSPNRIKAQKEIVLLPLKKGENQLVIKLYNGFDKELTYSINPLTEWTQYTKSVPAMGIGNSVR
ncbi:MAG: hypothetical protein GXZ03_06355, partial [Proteiniphilum sp.]|nr:hypothetical protein [Proteiniphilum sp.]